MGMTISRVETARIAHLFGLGRDDWLEGGPGNDYLDGGEGVDTASFYVVGTNEADAAVYVDLAAGIARGVYSGDDTLVSIESVNGSLGPDEIHGSNDYNVLYGNWGNDKIYPGSGGDQVNGGGGSDNILVNSWNYIRIYHR